VMRSFHTVHAPPLPKARIYLKQGAPGAILGRSRSDAALQRRNPADRAGEK
jgi:hypothetical protein